MNEFFQEVLDTFQKKVFSNSRSHENVEHKARCLVPKGELGLTSQDLLSEKRQDK
jgi:hypothetical protein